MKKKKIVVITGLTLLHFGITVVLFLMDFSAGMSRFDTGAGPALGEQILHVSRTILMWPIFYPLVTLGGGVALRLFPGLLGYIPMLINSFTWGIIVWLIFEKIVRRIEPNQRVDPIVKTPVEEVDAQDTQGHP